MSIHSLEFALKLQIGYTNFYLIIKSICFFNFKSINVSYVLLVMYFLLCFQSFFVYHDVFFMYLLSRSGSVLGLLVVKNDYF